MKPTLYQWYQRPDMDRMLPKKAPSVIVADAFLVAPKRLICLANTAAPEEFFTFSKPSKLIWSPRSGTPEEATMVIGRLPEPLWKAFTSRSCQCLLFATDDGDGVLNASDNCPFDSNAPQTNTDAAPAFPWIKDGVGPDGATLGGDACDADDDNDRCPDVNELSANPLLGGDRDPLNPWDFFDTPEPVLTSSATMGTRSHTVSLADVIGVLFYIGTSAANPSQQNANHVIYGSDLNANGIPDGQEYDRTIPNAAKLYRSGPPNGAVQIGDAIAALDQVGANCINPPP